MITRKNNKQIVFEMLSDNALRLMRKEAKQDFEDYSKHPRKVALIEEKMDICSKVIMACDLELESRRMRVAA